MRLLSCLLLVTCLSCVKAGRPVNLKEKKLCAIPDLVVLTKGQPKYLERILKRSIARWNILSERDLFFYGGRAFDEISEPYQFISARLASKQELKNWTQTVKGKFFWRADKTTGCLTGGAILIRPCICTDDAYYLENIIMHELGYALGLGHNEKEGTIMHEQLDLEGYGDVLELSENTIDHVQEIYSKTEYR